jgi:hypothetical protein
VDTRAVIIYGGWIHPDVSGYTTHHQLYTPLACAPCGYSNHCEFDRECMRKITPEMVAEAVREALRAGSKERGATSQRNSHEDAQEGCGGAAVARGG